MKEKDTTSLELVNITSDLPLQKLKGDNGRDDSKKLIDSPASEKIGKLNALYAKLRETLNQTHNDIQKKPLILQRLTEIENQLKKINDQKNISEEHFNELFQTISTHLFLINYFNNLLPSIRKENISDEALLQIRTHLCSLISLSLLAEYKNVHVDYNDSCFYLTIALILLVSGAFFTYEILLSAKLIEMSAIFLGCGVVSVSIIIGLSVALGMISYLIDSIDQDLNKECNTILNSTLPKETQLQFFPDTNNDDKRKYLKHAVTDSQYNYFIPIIRKIHHDKFVKPEETSEIINQTPTIS
jgi:hypothetical protein